MDNTNDNNSTNPLLSASDEKLVSGLEDVLEKQLKLMRTSCDKAASDLAEKTTEFVDIIGQKEILKDNRFATQRMNIQRLYKELRLATAERKQSVALELSKIRKGKRSVGAYKTEISPTHSNLL